MELGFKTGIACAAMRASEIVRESNIEDAGVADAIDIEFGLNTEHEYLTIPWDVYLITETTKKFAGVVEAKIFSEALCTAMVTYAPKDISFTEAIKTRTHMAVRPRGADKYFVFLIDTNNPTRTKRLGEVWATDHARAMKSATAKYAAEAENPGMAVSVALAEQKTKA